VHAIVRQGLAYVFRTGAAARNVVELAELPRLARRKVVAMSPEEAETFLGAARADRYYALWCVLVSGGLRPSEALGLTWPDGDLDAGKLHVQRSLVRRGSEGWNLVEPKTSAHRRVVVLPPVAVVALKAHKAAHAREQLRLRVEYQTAGFVYATEFGAPLSLPNLYRRNYTRICAAAGARDVETGAAQARAGAQAGPALQARIPDVRLAPQRGDAAPAGWHPSQGRERTSGAQLHGVHDGRVFRVPA
jgi:integrase